MLLIVVSIMTFTACGKGGNVGQPGDTGDKDTGDKHVRGPFPALVSYVGDEKWGYIDETGRFFIKPSFDYAAEFQDNELAVAGREGKVGVIDRNGRFVIAPKYESINEFSEGLAIAFDSKEFKVLDETGRVIYKSTEPISSFKEGRAAIQQRVSDNKFLYGFIDTSGSVVIQPRYQYVTDFDNGKAVVKLDTEGYAIIDRNGAALKTFDYYRVDGLSEGLAAFQLSQDSKFGYIDDSGKVVISPKFSEAFAFKDGMAVVNASADFSNREYGVIDRKGRYVLKPEYNDAMILGEGMLAAGKAIKVGEPFIGSKYAIAARNGKLLTDYIYYNVGQYNNGIAYADNGESTFFIDKTGQRDKNLPVVKGIGSLELLNNIISANIDSRLYYIDRAGNIIYKPADSITLKTGVTVSEVKYRPNRNYLVYYPQVSGISDSSVEKSINDRLKDMSITSVVTPDMDLDYSYEGDFNIEFYRKNLLELELWGYNFPFGAAHGMPTREYVQIDIKTGRFYELKDLFKEDSDYVKVLSGIVKKQIMEHGDEMGVWPDSYKGIAPDQPFFVDASALYLYFQPYEIAPYSSGFPTFKIPYAEIKGIIDTKGAFWKAFN